MAFRLPRVPGLPELPPLPGPSDAIRLVRLQTETLLALPEALMLLNRSVRSLVVTMQRAQRTIERVDRLTERMESVVEDLEAPLRALRPGLETAAAVLSDPVVTAVPEMLSALRDDALPVIRGLADTERKIASIATSAERLTGILDDVGRGLAALPGAALMGRFRPGAPPRDTGPRQVEGIGRPPA